MTKTIVVLLGGNSVEREVSLDSGQSVAKALEKLGHRVVKIDPKDELWETQLEAANPDYVFIALHGKDGEDGVMQSYLEIKGIPYSGSGVLGSVLAMHKDKAKLIWQQHGLPVLPFTTFSDVSEIDESWLDSIEPPYAMKIVNGGSSIGVKKVLSKAELKRCFDESKGLGKLFMLEKWASGPEYFIGILNGRALTAVEVVPGAEFYDYDAKYTRNDTKYFCPSSLDKDAEQKLQKIAVQAFNAIGCTHFGRMDFVADGDSYYLLEANTIPGFTDKSLFPMAAKNLGLSFEELLAEILPDFS